ncbi:MAG: hypothetical protein LBS02_02130 [Hungatella sp.]|jgi:hypothetical protein|nr:hypothetical protein [Hungatella sp.]
MEKLVKVVPELRWRQDYNFITIYNFKTDDLFKAPCVANDILILADGKHTVEDIINYLLNEKIVSQSEANRIKLEEYINDLITRNILFITD